MPPAPRRIYPRPPERQSFVRWLLLAAMWEDQGCDVAVHKLRAEHWKPLCQKFPEISLEETTPLGLLVPGGWSSYVIPYDPEHPTPVPEPGPEPLPSFVSTPDFLFYCDDLVDVVTNQLRLTWNGRAAHWALEGVHLEVLDRFLAGWGALADEDPEPSMTPSNGFGLYIGADERGAQLEVFDAATDRVLDEGFVPPAVEAIARSPEFPFPPGYVGFGFNDDDWEALRKEAYAGVDKAISHLRASYASYYSQPRRPKRKSETKAPTIVRNTKAERDQLFALPLLATWYLHGKPPDDAGWKNLKLRVPNDPRSYFRPLIEDVLRLDMPPTSGSSRHTKSRKASLNNLGPKLPDFIPKRSRNSRYSG